MRRRLLVSNVLLVAVVLLALEIPLAVVYARHEHDSLQGTLQRDAASLAALSEEIIEHPGEHDVGGLAKRFTAGSGAQVVIVDRNGNMLTGGPALSTMPTVERALAQARTGVVTSGQDDGRAYMAVPVGSGGDAHGAVLVARPDDANRRIHQFWVILLGIAAGVLAVAVIVSRGLARWAVDPLQRLDDHAADVGRGDFDVRVDLSHAPPEIRELAETFNEMAGQLDDLVASQRRFVADASHQLRTPLTALRLRLENLNTADADSVAATRDAALLETARLSRLVDGLLALARAERTRPEREPVDVAEVVEQRFEAWTPLAAEHNIDLRLEADVEHPVEAMFVPGHLDQILDNLIDNAIDATPSGRSVCLRLDVLAGTVEVHVTDEGPGMTDEQRRQAFAPFWQGSHRAGNGNSGLGLAIVDQLARASSATVTLERSDAGGIDATVRLPRSKTGAVRRIGQPVG
jgi:signal transduction histidine kinase